MGQAWNLAARIEVLFVRVVFAAADGPKARVTYVHNDALIAPFMSMRALDAEFEIALCTSHRLNVPRSPSKRYSPSWMVCAFVSVRRHSRSNHHTACSDQ